MESKEDPLENKKCRLHHNAGDDRGARRSSKQRSHESACDSNLMEMKKQICGIITSPRFDSFEVSLRYRVDRR